MKKMNELLIEAYEMAKDIHEKRPALNQQIVFDIVAGLLDFKQQIGEQIDKDSIDCIYSLVYNVLSANDTVDTFINTAVSEHLLDLHGMSTRAIVQIISAFDMFYSVVANSQKSNKRTVTLYDHTINLLTERGIKLHDLSKIVYDGQVDYVPEITLVECENAIKHVLKKREVQNAVITGIYLDKQSREDDNMDPYLKEILRNDESQFQVDELLSTAVSDVFGGIANSNRGYLDKTKPGIIGVVDSDKYNVFLDDLLAAIVAGAEAYIANKRPDGVYQKWEGEK